MYNKKLTQIKYYRWFQHFFKKSQNFLLYQCDIHICMYREKAHNSQKRAHVSSHPVLEINHK